MKYSDWSKPQSERGDFTLREMYEILCGLSGLNSGYREPVYKRGSADVFSEESQSVLALKYEKAQETSFTVEPDSHPVPRETSLVPRTFFR